MSEAAAGTVARLVLPELAATTRDGALAELSQQLAATGAIKDPAALTERLLEREQLGCTGLGGGIALPHCKWKGIDDVLLAIGRSGQGVDFGSSDGVSVTLIFLLLSPVDAPGLHLQALARISRRLKSPGLAQSLREAESAESMENVWRDAHAAVPLEVHG